MDPLWLAFGLTLFAGLATGIGSALAFAAKQTNHRFLSVSTGFSAGVMLYVSFVEIFQKGANSMVAALGDPAGHWANVGSFFGGIVLIGLIDQLVPSAENPHEPHPDEETAQLHTGGAPDPKAAARNALPRREAAGHPDPKKLLRMGLFTAFAIGIHNFPEGLATFLAALEDPKLGVAIAIAIALHNIPEGISVSVPIFFATGDRTKAFLWSLLSGLAEPVGAVIAYVGLRLIVGGNGALPQEVTGALFGGVAGIMVYISLDELLPTSRAYGRGHDTILGLVAGMVVMAMSLLMMR